jgi:hypothetical protein
MRNLGAYICRDKKYQIIVYGEVAEWLKALPC